MVKIVEGGPQGRLLVEGYGGGGFELGGIRHCGSILVLQDRVLAWPVNIASEIDEAALQPILEAAGNLEVLLIGSGDRGLALGPDLRRVLRDHGLGVDVMATPAACRTFNVLVMEQRAVAAALIAVE
ncbi:MAG: Mth938-like domain-containing protein [Kiloniellales bacterium]|nr:Mth938-like domain-containing protein [Kiloniellales bacterium]MDJ0981422.1 Mth938-like domain-containing protein [Kiloniellales bacterium]